MRRIVDYLTAALAPLGVDVLYADATGAGYPSVLLWTTPGQPDSEPAAAVSDGFEDLIGVTMVDTTGRNVLLLTGRVRALLDGASLVVDGRLVRLQRRFSETVRPDLDVTLPDTNTHPCYAVDRYWLTAQPIQGES